VLHLQFSEGLIVVSVNYPSYVTDNGCCSLCTELSSSVIPDKCVMKLIGQI
jgi:hypothetical protein